MKNQMRLFVLLALVALLVRAQTPAEPNYEDFLFNLKFPLDNYRPLLNQVQVETLPSEEVDQSALSVRSLTFPAQETECSSTQEQGSPCPLKENGKLMLCNAKVTYPVQEPSDIRAFEIRCDMATEEALQGRVRTRRSKSGRGGGSSSSGRGGSRGSRAGGGSSIAGVLDVNVKMKNQMRPFVLLALVALLVRAQRPAEPNYEDFLFNIKFPLDNYRPLLNQVQVETFPPEEVDQSALSVRSLTFPAQETECSSTQEQGSPCPLKENGELMLCNVNVAYPVREPGDIRAFEIRCDMATQEALLKMKNQMRLFVLLALVALLVRAQTPAEPNYEDFLFNLKFPLDNYRPLLNQVQVETLPSEEVDRSALSVRSLTFPAQETQCSSTQKQGSPCPLKENGKLMLCNAKVTYPVQEPSDIRAFEIRCDMATEEALQGRVRTRRSKSGGGSGRGGGSSSSGRGGSRGSRAGGGSSIAGGGNRNNGGTRTA
ncbi:uncharacterized protein LOC115374910 [Myripristis murdjan]|uniref:uncharacterized protein LOC115374910 n=1 Tax=Myripristis murdjan TaxID=586833 RepID=UPI001175E734|nr:uncharacterized protein LOC115374910 [Myripristis murdjan]